MRTRPVLFPPPARARLFALALAVALGPFIPATVQAARDRTQSCFFRGVYLLRQISPGEHWPKTVLPRGIGSDDATNALLMHPDRSFVLAAVLRDLETAAGSGKYPQAGYYAAHAAALLGRHQEAAASMQAYLGKAPFRELDHLFLVRELYAATDYPGVLEAARQWQLSDTAGDGCSEDRLVYVWGSLHAEGRHREAMDAVLSAPCASWRGRLLFARSRLALGDAQWAEAYLKSTLAAFPDKNREIQRLWNHLATADKYP
ncbi:MAG: hypothetical protein LBV01_05580 [Deltaproteobacteria bacterium]|jgi:tetratricopeptide (TPR) repeat protein|nr:hypothetical protein [Deltaproteobacteria bacterium]